MILKNRKKLKLANNNKKEIATVMEKVLIKT